ncbi:hypothetical protein LCI18_006546 [Fusarium solani-melongenae]|uniref:Uncharacterized protein n=1 Tax=Fusarium solani subsp. cucurbitae TaxID=2747967 RepID=A0ACD3Z374_FUSSC|nr:hypothetical protein LCI18_006546 [Fusarium solani-melongenae]
MPPDQLLQPEKTSTGVSISGGKGLNESPSWPGHPRPVPSSVYASICRATPYVPQLVIPVPFLDYQPISSYGDGVLEGIGLASTFWPIAFSAVLGALIRTIALFKAERGTKLGTLEVLLSSQTLVSALKSPFVVRIFTFWTLVLGFIWVISPAGGQAAYRTVRLTSLIETTTHDLMYSPAADIGLPFNRILWASSSNLGTQLGGVYAMFGAAISASNAIAQASNGSSPKFDAAMRGLGGVDTAIVAARMDLWQNVRIPEITVLPGYDSQDPYRWLQVPTDRLVTYESLVGVPVRGIPQETPGNISFQLSTTYATLECSPWFNTTTWREETPDALLLHKAVNSSITNEKRIGNYVNGFQQIYMDTPSPLTGFNFSTRNHTSQGPITQGSLVFGTKGKSTICDIGHIYVDVEVQCQREQRLGQMVCRSDKIRHSPAQPVPFPDNQMITKINQTDPGAPAAGYFIAFLPWIASSYHSGNRSPLENYLADPARGIEGDAVALTDEYTRLPLKVFAQRLAMVMNTALCISYDMPSILGFTDLNITESAALTGMEPKYGSTTGIFSTATVVYRVQHKWMGLYIVSLVVMSICAVATIVLRLLIRAPDFLTSVAGLTRDSPYINVPPGGSTLDGEERSRLLRNRRLKIVDVHPERDVGHIAFADDIGQMATKRFGIVDRVYA